ncbi:MAG: hypothetical protein PHF56_24585 [Desulfuromonadaceae bacterium]|nr:hypothetical protein [Desulfuromonadaceae bacterium]
MKKHILNAGFWSFVFCLLLLASSPVRAEEYSSTDLQILYTPFLNRNDPDLGNGISSSSDKLTAARLEHFGTWKYGDNFLSVDLTEGSSVGGSSSGSFGSNSNAHLFLVYVPRFSLTKILNSQLDGFVKNVYLAGRLERASYGSYRAENIGISFDLKIPGTAFFEQDFYARRTNYDKETEFLSRTVWLAPFSVGPVGMHFDGLALIKSTDNGTNAFTQLDLLADLYNKGQIQAGVRLESAFYKNYDRNTPYVMLKWVF